MNLFYSFNRTRFSARSSSYAFLSLRILYIWFVVFACFVFFCIIGSTSLASRMTKNTIQLKCTTKRDIWIEQMKTMYEKNSRAFGYQWIGGQKMNERTNHIKYEKEYMNTQNKTKTERMNRIQFNSIQFFFIILLSIQLFVVESCFLSELLYTFFCITSYIDAFFKFYLFFYIFHFSVQFTSLTRATEWNK